jgi:hypothetical protein
MSYIEKMLAGVLLCVGTVSSVCDTSPCSTSGNLEEYIDLNFA